MTALDRDDLAALAATLRAGLGIAHKADIGPTLGRLGLALSPDGVGDDCAAIPDGDSFLLLAIEGFIDRFVARDPFFAGWCGVMVNASDVAAMGGSPLAVVDAVWSVDDDDAGAVLAGLREAADTYGIRLAGGHTNARADGRRLAVAILGRATRLLTSFDARPGDVLVAAIDLRGRMRDPDPWWDASTGTARRGEGARLRGDLALLPRLAEDGLCRAGKDISMGGVIGTALMLAEASGIGCSIDPTAVPRPVHVSPPTWLSAFPSYGFLLAVRPADVDAVIDRFGARDIAAAAIGVCDDTRAVRLAIPGAGAAVVRDLAVDALLAPTGP